MSNEKNHSLPGTDSSSTPPVDVNQPAPGNNAVKDPQTWATGDEPMTGAQKSYLHTLSDEAGVRMDDELTKAQASEQIDELRDKAHVVDHRTDADPSASNTQKDPADWATGDEPMTGAQQSYLKTLCADTGEAFDSTLTKGQASAKIDTLRERDPRVKA